MIAVLLGLNVVLSVLIIVILIQLLHHVNREAEYRYECLLKCFVELGEKVDKIGGRQ